MGLYRFLTHLVVFQKGVTHHPPVVEEYLNPNVHVCVVIGSVLPAHRAVLVARCDVMAAMFSGKYAEARSRVVPIHGVSSDTFLSFLEYLYTDTCCPGG